MRTSQVYKGMVQSLQLQVEVVYVSSMLSGNCAATCKNFTGIERNGSNFTACRSSRINNLVLSNELIKIELPQ